MPRDLLASLPPARAGSPASAVRLPIGWSPWQWACVVVTAAAFALLLAGERSRREADARQTVTCEVFARLPAGGAAAGPLEVTVAYDALERRSDGFTAPAQPAGSAGQLAQYDFPLNLRGFQGMALRASGRIETIRLYDAADRSIARLSSERFQVGNDAPMGGAPVILHPARDGTSPAAWAALGRLPMAAAPGRFYLAGWWAFYACFIFGLAVMVAQLFAPGRSFDLRQYAGAFATLARWAERMRPLQLGLVVGLALAMAAVSAPNAHPDEYQHVAAARFYRNGAWLPPAMGDPRARDAIGPNGLSYHQDLDIVYLLAGKASYFISLIVEREDLALRLVNVGMLAALIVLAGARRVGAAASMLLLCPQVWYVFSYFNGDAMGFFLSALIVWQLAGRDTLLQRALAGSNGKLGIIWMGLLLGAVAISKKNYFTLPLLAAGCAAGQWWNETDPVARRRLFNRWSAVAVIALSIYAVRFEYDQSLYGFHKAEGLRDVAEALATPEYRPSQVLAPGAHWYMGLRERGVPAAALLAQPRWREESFMSFAGMYGWMSVAGPPVYYRLMGYLYLGFGAAFLFEYLRAPSKADVGIALFCLALCGVTLAASVYFSWTVGFQPQGRYLFPILPILAVLALRKPACLRAPLPIILGAGIFLASLYSFTLVALAHIAK